MPNMSYVRFENTFRDLQDCWNHLMDDDLSESEENARNNLIRLCQEIGEYEPSDANDDEE